MKKLYVTLLFCISLVYTGTTQPENVSHWRLGPVFPSSNFGSLSSFQRPALADAATADETQMRPFETEETRTGLFLDVGDHFYFGNIGLPTHIGIGLDASFINLSWTRVRSIGIHADSLNSEFEFHNHFITYSPRVGPIFSYSPATDVYFDAAFRWAPTAAMVIGSYRDEDVEGNEARDVISGFGYGLARFSTGVYVRYNLLSLGFEWEFGGMRFSGRSRDVGNWYSFDSRLNNTRFVIGFNFVKPPRR